jgi:biotin transport system substrate-specific component
MLANPFESRASDLRRSILIRVALVLAGSMLMALSARISFNIVTTVLGTIPITGQTLALPIVVALLGTRQSVFAMLAYLAEGALGLPVFAASGHAGIAVLVGPTATTAGYLWAYPVAAWTIGTLYDHGFAGGYFRRWVAIFLGIGIVFAGGYAVLAALIGPGAAFTFGVAPFIAGDIAKVTIAAAARNSWPKLAAGLRL